MKKLKLLMLAALIAVPSIINGAYLMYHTSTTYVRSDHTNPLYYDGKVSVRGTDWIGSDPWHYPLYSKITYGVPNAFCTNYTYSSAIVHSQGQSDNVQRIRTIRVRDSLNPINCKTTANWDIGWRQTTGYGPSNVD